MNKTNVSRNFYCTSEQFEQLEIFKTKLNSINKSYTEELQEFLFANNNDDYSGYMFSNSEDIFKELFKEKEIQFIDYITTKIDLNNGNSSINFRIFNKINELKLDITDGLITIDKEITEGWAVIKIELNDEKNLNKYTLTDLNLLPVHIREQELELYFSLREKHSLSNWTNLLLSSLGFSSSNLTFKEKFTILARAIPYCQENFSLLELGSKGTGKSTFYEDFSNEKIGLYTGTPTAANLFFNNTGKGTPGEITNKQVIAIDEINNMSFDDELTSNFKSFLEKGVFKRGEEKVSSNCSIAFLGNYDNFHEAFNNPEKILDSLKNKFFKDTAIISRLSFISYGWEVKPFSKSNNISENRFLQTYLIKIFQALRKQDLTKFIENRIDFHEKLDERDRKNIIKVVSGLLKLLHPNQIVRDKELIAYVEIAVENLKYKTTLKKFFENSNNTKNENRKSEYKLPTPIYVPKNESYKNNIDIINKEFILYNYIDLFKSNYSLKDFIIAANEFDSDNGSNTSINFFPINHKVEKKKETKLIGNVLIIDHPYIENEMLNIAISLTGAHENEEKINFYNKLKEVSSHKLNFFEEPGHFSSDYLLLSSKNNTWFGSFGSSFNFGSENEDNNPPRTDITNDIKNGYIPYYPKNIYSSPDFKEKKIYNYYSNFHLIEKFNPDIQIYSIIYLIEEEIYEISYHELKQPEIRQSQNGFGQNINSFQQTQFGFRQNIPTYQEKLNINKLIELLEVKNI